MKIDADVTRLQLLKSTHDNKKFDLEENFKKRYPGIIEASKIAIEVNERNIEMRKSEDMFIMEIYGQVFTDRALAAKQIRNIFEEMPYELPKQHIRYRGFDVSMYRGFNWSLILHGATDQTINIKSKRNLITDFDTFIDSFEVKIDAHKKKINEMEQNIIASKEAFNQPFLQEKELEEKIKRQSELNTILNYDQQSA